MLENQAKKGDMRLAFDDRMLVVSHRADPELAEMADRHYSRRTIGAVCFTGPGRDLTLRNHEGTIVFVWMWHNNNGEQLQRWDKQTGYCCSIFRNESGLKASEIILEAERIVLEEWGRDRVYTYVDPAKIRKSRTPGRCFLKAGWKTSKTTSSGLLLLDKAAEYLGAKA
jgi:hypothetical protein